MSELERAVGAAEVQHRIVREIQRIVGELSPARESELVKGLRVGALIAYETAKEFERGHQSRCAHHLVIPEARIDMRCRLPIHGDDQEHEYDPPPASHP
jgi:surfactin synthase thioesterase subunit